MMLFLEKQEVFKTFTSLCVSISPRLVNLADAPPAIGNVPTLQVMTDFQ